MAQVLPQPQAFRVAESARQRALDAYRIVDTLPEPAYDDIARLAAVVCDAPVALVSLIDRDRQWFKAQVGTDIAETPRDEAVCDHAIRAPGGLLEVPDLARDPRFARHPSVAGIKGARFYAGMPLVTPGGAAIGTVCVVDRQPRRLEPKQRSALASLARLVINLLEDRQRERVLERATLVSVPAGNEDAPPPTYLIALIQVQGHAELVQERGERIAEKILRSFDEALEACLRPGSGDAIDRSTDSAEFVAILHGDGADEVLECLRKRAVAAAREAGLTVAIGSAEAEDGLEKLEPVFLRADEALSAEKDKLRPPSAAA
ncbi:MAG TPA: GAF domain-containing protein [Xanthomonadaceae bacterium]|nr:GAF domain-containing protein [Xanthomonadaceae bacterium]